MRITNKKLASVIDAYISQLDKNPKKQAEKIKLLIRSLEYQLRYTELTEAEKKDYAQSGKVVLSEDMKKKLNECKSETEKNQYIESWSRSIYIRKCCWEAYLCGEENKKPQ